MKPLSRESAKALLRQHGPRARSEEGSFPAVLYARAPLDLVLRLQTLVVARKQAKMRGTLEPGTPTQQASIVRAAVDAYLRQASPAADEEVADGRETTA